MGEAPQELIGPVSIGPEKRPRWGSRGPDMKPRSIGPDPGMGPDIGPDPAMKPRGMGWSRMEAKEVEQRGVERRGGVGRNKYD